MASSAPNRQWLADFQKTDVLLIENNGRQLATSDAEMVVRLQQIYTNAKWEPYWHTLPGNLDERTISLLNGETKLRHFSYTGTLWEAESYTENRTAELSETDRKWIEMLFSMVPESDSMQGPETAK